MAPSLFKKKEKPPQSAAPAQSPFLAASRAYDDRYAALAALCQRWRIVAFASLATSFVLAVGFSIVKNDQKVLTYVVREKADGGVLSVSPMQQVAAPREDNIRAQLNTWIIGARTVYVDNRAIEVAVTATYNATLPGSPAYSALAAYHTEKSPYARAAQVTVDVAVESVMPLTQDTWQIEWTETTRQRSGKIDSVERWVATVNVKIATPTSRQQVYTNPFGVFVNQYSWATRL
ncbi:type IV secretion system protein [Xanthomonas perforans]|uniref:type IV secretion system protein n=1 Tax=Xanthomonas perforans TaxID=442694 RepID=UPI0023593A09|nr:type IV secretion system protein [Xanthomonas perforans]MDC9654346.1 type IV secretion system protein [Xanthomonas perforans]MEB2158973.1 type IV secretion system protein [Xanthomonas campestris pv. campestris]